MSLQVWLPLTKDLKNQGIHPLNIVNVLSGVTNEATGKLGNCYTATGTATNVATPCNLTFSKFSAAAWVRFNGQRKTWDRAFGMGGSGCYFGLGCEHTNGTGIGFHFYKTVNDTNTSVFDIYAATIQLNTWVHYCMTYDGTKYYIYLNGVLLAQGNANQLNITVTMTNLYIFGGSASGYAPVSLNDVRIYDHCLSLKEVEEIAKGLVLHYKLNDKLFINQNLFSLDKAIGNNATKTSIEKKNNSLILTSHDVNYGSFITADSNYLTFTAGTTYTLSGHIKVITKGTDNYSPILCIRNSNHIILVSKTVSDNESDVTMTWTPSSTITGYVSGINTWSNGSSNTTNAVTEFSNIKLEIGSIQTAWIPNINDKIYTALGYNILTIYDTSGYNYNGITSGGIELIIGARYDTGMKASTAANATITTTIEGLPAILANGTKYTLACWARPTGTNDNGWVIKLGSNQCGLWWAKSLARWVWNENDNGKRCANPTISGDYTNWHHLVTTVDKTTASAFVAKHYVDGLPAEDYTSLTWDNGSNVVPAGTDIVITLTNADLSDIRIYTTALTEAQIKELYNTSATIDNNGNIYARELVE